MKIFYAMIIVLTIIPFSACTSYRSLREEYVVLQRILNLDANENSQTVYSLLTSSSQWGLDFLQQPWILEQVIVYLFKNQHYSILDWILESVSKKMFRRTLEMMFLYSAQWDLDYWKKLYSSYEDLRLSKDAYGRNLFFYTVLSDSSENLVYFLSQDQLYPLVKQQDIFGSSVIHHLAKYGSNVAMAQILIGQASLQGVLADGQGYIPLYYALFHKNFSLAQFFNTQASFIAGTINLKQDLLDLAITTKNSSFVLDILRKLRIEVTPKHLITSLTQGDQNFISDLQVSSQFDFSSLSSAQVFMALLEGGNLVLLEYLAPLWESFNSEYTTDTGMNYVMAAVLSGNPQMLVFLRERKLLRDDLDNEGRSLVHYAGMSGSIDMYKTVRSLFHYASDDRDKQGKTALMYAVSFKNLRLAQFLKQAQVCVGCKDIRGETVAFYAVRTLSNDFVGNFLEEIQKASPNIYQQTVALQAAFYQFFSFMDFFSVLELAQQDAFGRHALFYLVNTPNIEKTFVASLIERDLSVQTKWYNGDTFLQYASKLWGLQFS